MRVVVPAWTARFCAVLGLVAAVVLGVTCGGPAELHAAALAGGPLSSHSQRAVHHDVNQDLCHGPALAPGANSTAGDVGAVVSVAVVASAAAPRDIADSLHPLQVPRPQVALFLLHAALLI